jgi:hypothetical protein
MSSFETHLCETHRAHFHAACLAQVLRRDRRGPNGCQPDDAEEPKLVPTMGFHGGYEFRFTSEPPDDSDDEEAF